MNAVHNYGSVGNHVLYTLCIDIANLYKNSLKSPNLTLLIDTIKEISENAIISVKHFNIED